MPEAVPPDAVFPTAAPRTAAPRTAGSRSAGSGSAGSARSQPVEARGERVEALLADLTPSQLQAVTTGAAPLCVLAGAGAGKTRVVTRRIAYRVLTGSAEAHHTLALTFSRRAAAEMGARLSGLGLRDRVTAGTFHAVAAAQLRQWWRDRGTTPPTLLERKGRLLATIAADRTALAGVDLGGLAGQIEWAKSRLVSPADFEAATAGRPLPAPGAEIASLYDRYEHEKTRRGLVDFDDLLARCTDALERDATFAGAQRWRWRHVYVDEFQDLNPLQHRLLTTWLGSRVDLCAVGDPNQAIYGWNGADPGLLMGFGRRWPTAEVVRLDDNHRCTPQVVAAAAAALGVEGTPLRSTRPDGPAVGVRAYPSEEAEAHGVAGQLRQARASGLGWSQMAVLVRTNAQTVALRPALRAAGIPHRVPGGAALLQEPAVVAALDDLRDRPGLPFALAVADLERVARGDDSPPSPPRLTGAVEAGPGAPTPAPSPTPSPTPSPARPPARPAAPSPARPPSPAPESAVAGLSALATLAHEYAQLDPAATVASFVAWLPTAAGDDRVDQRADVVTICSFHRAKGLEWRAVWLCGLERGLVPLGRATTPAAEAEERRLLYVALTRAERDLHCSWAQTRTFGARAVPREPSPWLARIGGPPATTEAMPTLDAEDWRRRLADQRRRLADGSPRPSGPGRRRNAPARAGLIPPDPILVDQLRAWRAQRARAAGVPAHVLFHDRTLTALASLRPETDEDLLAVPGLGPVKAARFGVSLLALVAHRRQSA